MQLNHLASLMLAATLGVGGLSACAPAAPPGPAQIEALAMTARQNNDPIAEWHLGRWADRQLPVAQRELGLIYQRRPSQRSEAQALFECAARAGDAEAAYALGEMLRTGAPAVGIAPAPALAARWLRLAAERRNARAALMLGMMLRSGDGMTRDDSEGARWLALAGELGNPHAMFLLANAYREGRGVHADPARARILLEDAAEHEYPPAIQELALAVQAGDAYSAKDEVRAAHLLKEANEHRRNNWNRF